MNVIYPGTFDPITNGHLDILMRAKKLFGGVTLLVANHPWKSTLFTVEERVEMIRDCTAGIDGIKVDSYEGLLVKYITEKNVDGVIRGLRAVSDFEYEFQMALTNREMCRDFETIFFMTEIKHTYLSSSMVREIAKLGGDISQMVPPPVSVKLKEKYSDVL